MLPTMTLLLLIPCRALRQSGPNRPTDPALLVIRLLRSTRRRPTQRSPPIMQTLLMVALVLSPVPALGARMLRQIHRARLRQRNTPVIVIGTDLADLCQNDLRQAIQSLQHQPLVLGPSSDGGYWLLGLGPALTQNQLDALFDAVPWGSNKVFDITCARARVLGLTPHQLSRKNDIDCLADLRSWQR